MKFGTHIILALRFFYKVRLKLYAVLLCLGFGLAMLYASFYLKQVIPQDTARRFYSQGFDLFSIMKQPGSAKIGPSQVRPFDASVAHYLLQNSDYVIGAAPELLQTAQVHAQNVDLQVPVIGVLDGYLELHGLQISMGRDFTRFDSTKSFCIIGNQLLQKLRTSENDSLVGKSIYLGRELVHVIGVMNAGTTFHGEYSVDDAVLVPLKYLQQYAVNPEITKITVRANPNPHVSDVVSYLEKTLSNYLGDISQYEISNQGVFLRNITARVKRFSTILSVAGILLLLVGSWGLLRFTVYSILRRRKEIAIVSDFGYKKQSLIWQFLTEISLLVLIYFVTGIASGIVLSYLMASLNSWGFFVSGFAMLITGLTGLLIGASMSIYPTLQSLYSSTLMSTLKEL